MTTRSGLNPALRAKRNTWIFLLTLGLLEAISLTRVHAGWHTNIYSVGSIDHGWYNSAGYHDPNNPSFVTGNVGGARYASWFSFTIPSMPAPFVYTNKTITPGYFVRRADLDKPFDPTQPQQQSRYAWELLTDTTMHAYSSRFESMSAQLAFDNAKYGPTVGSILRVWDVTTPFSDLQRGGSGQLTTYQDLCSGISYGSSAPISPGYALSIDLNSDGMAAIFSVGATSFSVGCELVAATSGEYIFGGKSDGDFLRLVETRDVELVWTQTQTTRYYVAYTESPGFAPVPEPDAILLFVLGGLYAGSRRLSGQR